MRLGEFLTMYRLKHGLTMQMLADACGFSKAYLSMLEKGINPQTGKPYSPTMQTFEKIARGTGQDIDSLFKLLDDDQPITINASPKKLSQEELAVVDGYRNLTNDGRRDFWSFLNYLKFKYAPETTPVHITQNNRNGDNNVTGF